MSPGRSCVSARTTAREIRDAQDGRFSHASSAISFANSTWEMPWKTNRYQRRTQRNGSRVTHLANEGELVGGVIGVERVAAFIVAATPLVVVLLVAVRRLLSLGLGPRELLVFLGLRNATLVLGRLHPPAVLGLLEILEYALADVLAPVSVLNQRCFKGKGTKRDVRAAVEVEDDGGERALGVEVGEERKEERVESVLAAFSDGLLGSLESLTKRTLEIFDDLLVRRVLLARSGSFHPREEEVLELLLVLNDVLDRDRGRVCKVRRRIKPRINLSSRLDHRLPERQRIARFEGEVVGEVGISECERRNRVDVREDLGPGDVLVEGADALRGELRGVGELAECVEAVVVLDERVRAAVVLFDGFEPGGEAFGSLDK